MFKISLSIYVYLYLVELPQLTYIQLKLILVSFKTLQM